MRQFIISICHLFAFLMVFQFVNAQQYKIDREHSEMTVEGTSTLHDWHSEVFEMDGEATIEVNNGEITEIDDMIIKVSVGSIKSGKNGMDKNAHEALKEAEFPDIQFTLTRLEDIAGDQILGIGLLTIAGVTHEVNMNVSYTIVDSGDIEFDGMANLNMTDFEIDPPTALFGTVKTGDPVKVIYKVRFKQS